MTEKFRIQVPADGVGGIIVRSQYLAQRLTEGEAREVYAGFGAALDQIASRKPIVCAVPPDAPAPKISRRQDADYSQSEKTIVNLALDLAPNPRPLFLQPWLPGRSVQWISAKLHRETRARAQNSALPSHKADGQPHSAGGNVGEAAERLASGAEDAGRALQEPRIALQQEIVALREDIAAKNELAEKATNDQVALLAEKDAEIQGLRRARDAMIEQRLLAEKGTKDQVARLTDQLAAKDRVINRLQRAQDRVPVAQNQSWGLTQSATPMPDIGPIKLPTAQDAMKRR